MSSGFEPGPGGQGLGIAYLEAGAYGLPCIAGDRGGGITRLSIETAIAVGVTDQVAVASAIRALLKDPELRVRWGDARARAC
jgi:phosphatidylinositol alpha-1,6-mannosyltransferase